MSRLQPEAVVRWLDDLDCAACALRLIWGRRPIRLPGPLGRWALPLLIMAVLALGPNVGI